MPEVVSPARWISFVILIVVGLQPCVQAQIKETRKQLNFRISDLNKEITGYQQDIANLEQQKADAEDRLKKARTWADKNWQQFQVSSYADQIRAYQGMIKNANDKINETNRKLDALGDGDDDDDDSKPTKGKNRNGDGLPENGQQPGAKGNPNGDGLPENGQQPDGKSSPKDATSDDMQRKYRATNKVKFNPATKQFETIPDGND